MSGAGPAGAGLAGAGLSSVGLAMPAGSMDDHFAVALVHALADPLIQAGMSLVTKVVDDDAAEEQVYRHWAKVGGISGVALLEVRPRDSRVGVLRSLGFPIAAVADATVPVDFPAVVVDLDASVSVLQSFLATRLHRRAVYIVGPEESAAASARAIALQAAAPATSDTGGDEGNLFEVVRTGHDADAAAATVFEVLAAGPATLVFDSDVHAAAALTAIRARGLAVPGDAAIISWTNSALCRSASRAITAVDRRGGEIGAMLGARMLAAIAGDRSTHERAPDPVVVLGETA